jgi:hypothetical protein
VPELPQPSGVPPDGSSGGPSGGEAGSDNGDGLRFPGGAFVPVAGTKAGPKSALQMWMMMTSLCPTTLPACRKPALPAGSGHCPCRRQALPILWECVAEDFATARLKRWAVVRCKTQEDNVVLLTAETVFSQSSDLRATWNILFYE